MKKKYLFLLLLAFLQLLSTDVFAIPSAPCVNDCPSTPFGPKQYFTMTLSGGCIVQVVYKKRVGCNSSDLYIVSIFKLSPSCNLLTIPALTSEVTSQMLLLNPMHFKYLDKDSVVQDTCYKPIRVIKGACWNVNDSLVYSCDSLACCINNYKVCYDSLKNRIITLETAIVTGPCHDSTCVDVCGSDSTVIRDTTASHGPLQHRNNPEQENLENGSNPSNNNSDGSYYFDIPSEGIYSKVDFVHADVRVLFKNENLNSFQNYQKIEYGFFKS